MGVVFWGFNMARIYKLLVFCHGTNVILAPAGASEGRARHLLWLAHGFQGRTVSRLGLSAGAGRRYRGIEEYLYLRQEGHDEHPRG